MKRIAFSLLAGSILLGMTPAFAFDVGVDVGPGGVRVGPRHRDYRDYDERHYFRERPYYRNGSDCRRVTIERSDGSVIRKLRCD